MFRPISFGRVNVTTPGTPVVLGISTLSGAIAVTDTQLSVASAAGFTADMVPFSILVDQEPMVVTAINGTTFNVKRQIDPSNPAAAHQTGAQVVAPFRFAVGFFSVVAGLTGKVWLGTKRMAAGAQVGTIKEFAPNPSGGIDDNFTIPLQDHDGDPLLLTDYAIDVANGGEGLYVTLWVR